MKKDLYIVKQKLKKTTHDHNGKPYLGETSRTVAATSVKEAIAKGLKDNRFRIVGVYKKINWRNFL